MLYLNSWHEIHIESAKNILAPKQLFTSVIDYFEIFINKPPNLHSRVTTWSQYKHHNTVKFFIGVSPQGVITFIFKARGGRISDKYLTEHCSILKNILPGDYFI